MHIHEHISDHSGIRCNIMIGLSSHKFVFFLLILYDVVFTDYMVTVSLNLLRKRLLSLARVGVLILGTFSAAGTPNFSCDFMK